MATSKVVKNGKSSKKVATGKAVKASVAKIRSNQQYTAIVKAAEAKVNTALCIERGVEKVANGNAVEALPQGQLTWKDKNGALHVAGANALKDGARREKMFTGEGSDVATQMLFRLAEPLSIFTRGGITAAIAVADAKLAPDARTQKFFDAIADAVFAFYPEAAEAVPGATRTRGSKKPLPVDPELEKFLA
jgi:hypothetical protein